PPEPAQKSAPKHSGASPTGHPDSLSSSVVSTPGQDAYFRYGAVSTDHHHRIADDLLCRRGGSGPAVRCPPDASLAVGNGDHLPTAGGRRLLALARSTHRGVLGYETEAAPEGT